MYIWKISLFVTLHIYGSVIYDLSIFFNYNSGSRGVTLTCLVFIRFLDLFNSNDTGVGLITLIPNKEQLEEKHHDQCKGSWHHVCDKHVQDKSYNAYRTFHQPKNKGNLGIDLYSPLVSQ